MLMNTIKKDIPISYIIGNNQKVIDTLINPDDTTIVEYTGKLTNTPGTSLMGCIDSNRFHLFHHTGSEVYFYTGTSGWPYAYIDISIFAKYTIQKGDFLVNGSQRIAGGNTIVGNRSIWIFNCNNKGNKNTNNTATMECHGVKIWKQSELVRDMVPVLHDGRACLFDKISKTYFFDIFGGEFDYGE